MIEVARYMLALIVALTHLQPLGMGRPGSIAVFAFYTLSGYLMTRVLNERYGFTARGTAAFLLNRVLRLWPAYFAILGLTLIALWFLPLQNFYPLIRFPMTPAEIVGNIAILGQVTFDFVQWSSLAKPTVTSWSLSIEVFSYLLLGGAYQSLAIEVGFINATIGFEKLSATLGRPQKSLNVRARRQSHGRKPARRHQPLAGGGGRSSASARRGRRGLTKTGIDVQLRLSRYRIPRCARGGSGSGASGRRVADGSLSSV